MNSAENVVKIGIDNLLPNKYQPRKYFDEELLSELANSIKIYGILNPILVRKNNDKYEIIAGERRWRAAKMCGLTEVPVIIKDTTEQQSAELALIENLQRQDLTAIEAAKSYEEIIRLSGHTQNELATKIGKSQSSIANKLRLLTLPEEIQNAVINKQISERHARCLLDVKEKEKQLEILNKIIKEKLTVKETEELIDIENINNDDIKTAIADIMKSLNINEEKEEKEDENMNNGNFFPNYDNNMNASNNMAPMNNPTPVLSQENVMPTLNSELGSMVPPQIMPTLEQNEINPMPQQIETPILNNNMNVNTPVMDAPLFSIPVEEPVVNPNTFVAEPINNPPQPEMPLFNNNINTPVVEEPLFANPEPQIINEPVGVSPIPSLFEQPIPSTNISQNNYEIPVMNQQEVAAPTPVTSVTEVENLLINNGINYKKYSNNEGHCIIIEMTN